MAQIIAGELINARVFVGAQQTLLGGAGPDDYFSIEPDGDAGTMVTGVQGDVMFVQQIRNGYVGTFTFVGGCSGVNTLLELYEAGSPFLINVNYNDFTLTAVANVRNIGAWMASAGNNTRTIVLNMAKLAGDTTKSIGKTVVV